MYKALLVTVAFVLLTGCNYAGHPLAPQLRSRLSSAAAADTGAPENWLAQKVCVDGSNAVAPVDPFDQSDPFGNGCAGYTERNIQQTDRVPYYRYNPGTDSSPSRFWYAYAFPITGASGEQMFAMARELVPQNNPPSNWYVNPTYSPAETHWDLYRLQNDWVSNASTRDGSGFNQIFYGNANGTATPYNGWVDFPVSYLAGFGPAGTTSVPVTDYYWEQSASPWPVPARSAPTSTSTQTTWTLLTGYTFDSGKRMNTLVAYHQPKPNTASSTSGIMEVWYFTMPYGPSRWEEWSAAAGHAKSRSSSTLRCNPVNPQTFSYHGQPYTYYLTNCVDWTRTTIATAPSTLPALPVPETNVLANMHFSNDPVNTSGSVSGWAIGSGVTVEQMLSTVSADTGGKYQGVRFLRVSCNSTCAQSSTIAQDLPVSANGTYAFGVDARTESGIGQLQASLSQVDMTGAVLAGSTTAVTSAVTTSGSSGSCGSSVVLCGTYVGGNVNVSLLPGAVALREEITPLTSGTRYDITDAYLARQ